MRKSTREQEPLVSVIIPVNNGARFVADSIRSALAQDYAKKEIIVVDDGSTDDTPSVLASFGDRITVVTQSNAGAPSARNTGLAHAKGQFIAFLDADDLWLPVKLTAQVRYLEGNPNVGLVYNAWRTWYPDAIGQYRPVDFGPTAPLDVVDRENSGFIYNKLLMDCVVHTSTVMLRRAVVEQVGGFDPGLFKGEDYDYWLRVSRVTEIHKLAAVLSLYRIAPQSICRTPSPVNYEYQVLERALRRWGPIGPTGVCSSEELLRQRRASLLFGFAYDRFHSGDRTMARRTLVASLRYRPFSVKAWLYLCLTFVPSPLLLGKWRLSSDK